MSKPQLENGFTRIANEILEGLAKTNLNGTQRRILDVVFRQTYGYQRKSHELSLTFIAQGTGLNKKQIQRELNRLIERGILTVTKDATFNRSRELEFNKDTKRWLIEGEVTNKTPPPKSDTHTGSELDTSTGSELDPQIKKERKLKERSVYDKFVKELLPLYRGRKSKSTRDNKLPKILNKYSQEEILKAIENYNSTLKVGQTDFILNESTFWNGKYIDFLDENFKENEISKETRLGIPPSTSVLGVREELW